MPLHGTTPRAVGLATPRRGRLSAPARATAELVRTLVAADVPDRPGLHLRLRPHPDLLPEVAGT
jgi:hypothetical protein